MKILQKLKFMLMRKDTPTEVRPDDITSKHESCDCGDGVCAMPKKGEEETCDCCDHECESK